MTRIEPSRGLRRWLLIAAGAGLLLAGALAPAAAQEAPPSSAEPAQPAGPAGAGRGEHDVYETRRDREYDPETTVFGPLPRLRLDDGNINLGAGALMQFDAATYDQNAQGGPDTAQALYTDLDTGLAGRRGIFLVNGIFYKDFIAFVSHDVFDPGTREVEGLRSALLAWRGLDPLWLIVGQQNLPDPLDAATFSSQRTFMEESMSSGAFGYATGTPSLGAAVLHRTKNHYVRVGLWGVPVDEYGHDSEGWGVHGRATYAPISERDRALHFGVSGYWRKPTVRQGDVGGSERFASRPELHVDDLFFVDTGNIPRIDSFVFGGVEMLANRGPWNVQAEYHRVWVDRYDSPHDAPFRDLTFDGYYVQTSYYLTGESQNFLSNFATPWRVQPNQEFDLETGGWGAVEVAARFSHIDLDSGTGDLAHGGIRGGVADNYSLALNWYPTALTRVSVNYVHSNIDNLSDSDLHEGGIIDAVGVRLQWEF